MRRRLASALSAAALLLLLLGASVASADPIVTFAPEVSSGVLGGPGSVDVTIRIAGTEYGGFPPPVVGLVLTLPAGTTMSATTHATCSKQVLEQTGPSGCPEGSVAGPIGSAHGVVSFGSERVEESALLESFYAPGGGLNFFVDGHSPVSLEILAHGNVVGNVITMEVPLVSTVPGAPYASLTELWLRFGETEEEEELSQFTSGLTLPLECPTGTLSWAAAVTFDEGGANPPIPDTTESSATTACPTGQEPSRSKRAAEALARKHAEDEAAATKKAEEEAAINKRHAEEAELATLRALVKRLQEELHAGVKVTSVRITRHRVILVIKTSEAGVVTITGIGIKKVSKPLSTGTHAVTLALTHQGRLRRTRHRAISVSIRDKVGARTVIAAAKLKL